MGVRGAVLENLKRDLSEYKEFAFCTNLRYTSTWLLVGTTTVTNVSSTNVLWCQWYEKVGKALCSSLF